MTCRNGEERCGGPWASQLPCFECYMDAGKALVPVDKEETRLPVPV